MKNKIFINIEKNLQKKIEIMRKSFYNNMRQSGVGILP